MGVLGAAGFLQRGQSMTINYTAGVAEGLITIQRLSEEIGVPEATLRYWRQQGTGPKSARIGRRVMYRRADVEAWIQAQFDQPA